MITFESAPLGRSMTTAKNLKQLKHALTSDLLRIAGDATLTPKQKQSQVYQCMASYYSLRASIQSL